MTCNPDYQCAEEQRSDDGLYQVEEYFALEVQVNGNRRGIVAKFSTQYHAYQYPGGQ